MKPDTRRVTKRKPFENRRRFLQGPPRFGLGRNMVIGGLAALLLSSFSVLGLYIYVNGSALSPSEKLDHAMRFLRQGDSESSFRIAKSVDPKSLKKKVDVSKRSFLLGVSEREAIKGVGQRSIVNEKNELAVKHLEKSRDLAFPDGYEGLGNYYLGMALFDLFRWEEAERPLEIASERWPQGRADAIERLVDIDLSFDNQDPDSALARIEHWRSLPRSSGNETERALLKEMQARFKLGDIVTAAALLESIPADSLQRPAAELVHGRCMQRLAEKSKEPERTERLRAAMANFQRVLESEKTSVSVRRQSNLELGRVVRNMGKIDQAVSIFSALRLSSPYEPESLVSGLEEIDCLIDLHRTSDASETLEHITKSFGNPDRYKNDWMPLSDMRKRVVALGERMIASKVYSDAARFADHLPPFCEDFDRISMKSRIYEQWANQILKTQPESALLSSYFNTAAQAYEGLSVQMIRTPHYEEFLWRAIENYRLSGAFQKSNLLLDNYLLFESRENQPKALLAKARNYNAMEQPKMAMISLKQILESNTSTPLVYDARLEAARLRSANNEFQEAEDLIVQNLYFGDLTPASPVWRESLFLLGDVLYRRGEKLHDQASEAIIRDPNKSYENLAIIEKSFDELVRSIARTEEGLRRFENDPRRLQMLYTMAKACQMASSWPEMLVRENRSANEDTISKWKLQRKELLNQARNAYSRLRQEITSQSESDANTTSENFLRNSFFGEADLLYEAGSFEEAIVAYQEATTRFISEPESLEAMIQIASCQIKLGKVVEGKRTLEMAKDVLARIPVEKNTKFKAVTSHDRTGWEQYIDWHIRELEKK